MINTQVIQGDCTKELRQLPDCVAPRQSTEFTHQGKDKT